MTMLLTAVAALQTTADPDKFNGYLLLGYGVMWLIVMIYIASLALRQRNLRRDIELMEQILREDDEVGN
jgi:CcmD family protein